MTGLICLSGCSGGSSTSPKPKPQKEKPILDPPLSVHAPNGEALVRNPPPGREPRYHIKWEDAQVEVNDSGVFAGTMENASGEMYEDSHVANTFRADRASADRDTQLLTLMGHIQVVSAAQKSTLSCDRVEWHAKEKIVKAFGNVQVSGTNGTLSGLNEVWATPDLKYFSTPSMFKKP